MTGVQRCDIDGSSADAREDAAHMPKHAYADLQGIYKQAKRSLIFGSLVALGFLACFGALVVQMPKTSVSLINSLLLIDHVSIIPK